LKTKSSLSSLIRPGRYTDGEINVITKSHESVDVKFALCYPDLYEIGMSNYGIHILYNVINRREDALCERVFAVWGDYEGLLRRKEYPLLSLESGTKLSEFDIIGFSLEYELTYTNMLNMLDLAHIPIYSEMRDGKNPLVMAGGTAMFNPEPVANFLDCIVIGEGEEVVGEIIDVVKILKSRNANRRETLKALKTISGVYVPSLKSENEIIQKRYVKELRKEMYPYFPIVPYIPITHDRLTVEIMRGCTQGCRFCQAGFVTRPLREVPIEDIMDVASNGIRNTGWEDISFLSLSITGYSRLYEIIQELKSRFPKTSISLPSLRGDAVTQDFADALTGVRKGSLTIAPEAGSERLRAVINKNISDDEILNSCEVAMKNGWRKLKLYFMVGLPTETSEDVHSIIELVKRIRKIVGRRALKISLSPFVPKPHTPFQLVAQDSLQLIREKEKYIVEELNAKGIDLNWRNPEVSFLEAVFSRGSREVAKVIEEAWNRGSRFEEWSEEFDYSIWESAFEKTGVDPGNYVKSLEKEQLVWNFVDAGVAPKYLLKEKNRAMESKATVKGRVVYESNNKREGIKFGSIEGEEITKFGRKKKRKRTSSPMSKRRIRVRFSKVGSLIFISHLDTIRLISRAIRRAGIDIAYTKGFRKRPRISFGPPLPMFVSGRMECFDLYFDEPITENIKEKLNNNLPEELVIKDVKQIFIKAPSISKIVKLLHYRIEPVDFEIEKVHRFLNREHIVIYREKKNKRVEINIRPFIESMELNNSTLDMMIKFLPSGSVRLEEVLSFFDVDIADVSIERVSMYAYKQGKKVDPFDY
jgi:radical SAM family uncharacterized protein/radical SAM-linked protein